MIIATKSDKDRSGSGESGDRKSGMKDAESVAPRPRVFRVDVRDFGCLRCRKWASSGRRCGGLGLRPRIDREKFCVGREILG